MDLDAGIIEALGKLSIEAIAILTLGAIVYIQLMTFSKITSSNEKLASKIEKDIEVSRQLLDVVKKSQCGFKKLNPPNDDKTVST